MTRLASICLVLLAACGGGAPPGGGGDDAGDDAGEVPDADPNCHWDCFGSNTCVDGVVTHWDSTPVPCEYWEGECPNEVALTCAQGCRADLQENSPYDPPEALCEENRPKQVGDPCVDDSGCRPEVATVHDDGSVTNVYLQCDVAAGQCVTRDAPVVADYGAPCGLDSSTFLGATGLASSDACSTTVCAWDEAYDCDWQICTTTCASDGDCPVGTTCVDWGLDTRACLTPGEAHDFC